MLKNYFILKIPCQTHDLEIFKKITLFFFENFIENHYNISEINIISVEAAKVTH